MSLQTDGFTFCKVYLERISNITMQQKNKDSNPDYTIKSLDTDVIVKSLALVPDASFKANGMMTIKIAGGDFLDPTSIGDFSDLTAYTIPLPDEGLKLPRGKTIDFFFWTSMGTTSAITISALVSKDVKLPK